MATPRVYVICDQNCKFESMTKEQIYAAILQAVNEGTIGNIDAGFITTIKTINGVPLRFFVGEQAAYDALTAAEKKDLFAIITNDTTRAGLVEALEALKKSVEALDKRTTRTAVLGLKIAEAGFYHIRGFVASEGESYDFGVIYWDGTNVAIKNGPFQKVHISKDGAVTILTVGDGGMIPDGSDITVGFDVYITKFGA